MINKIAAGEVVERPSSVVKELIENSIDAGATIITIEVKDGGISLIRVSDNGRGISKEDVKNVFLRHATSKIENMDDLEKVLTLGFRGEAMSSISAVSQLEMVTKEVNSTVGSHIEIHGGKILREQSIGAADGTSIIVRNLFYNVPARRKFLKRSSTESGYISDIVDKFILGHPEVSFKYILNGKKLLDTNGDNKLKSSIFHIYGKEISKSLLEIEYSSSNLLLTGYIGKPEVCRSNRSYGNFFVNGRFIKNQLVQSAVEEAYKTKLPIGKFPVYILKLSIDPSFVDVNVHPTKLEIKFSNEDEIYDLVFKAVDTALKSNILIPKYISKNNLTKNDRDVAVNKLPNTKEFVEETPRLVTIRPLLNTTVMEVFSRVNNNSIYNHPSNTMHLSEDKKRENFVDEKPKNTFFKDYKIIGQILNTYWLIEESSSLYLIDQHAAHERVLYEDFIHKYKNEQLVSQRLLQPQAITLSIREREIYGDNKQLFERAGFEIEVFGEDTFAIRSVPFIFKEGISPTVFMEIIDRLGSIDSNINNIYDTKLDRIASFSCKAAVKANDKLSYEEAKALIEKLISIENPFTCPHGRPTIVELTKYEIEKMFKRIQ